MSAIPLKMAKYNDYSARCSKTYDEDLSDEDDICTDRSDEHDPHNDSGTDRSGDSHLWDSNPKLFVQLLDDLDDIGCSTPSAHRRRKARELFSSWLFSADVRSPEISELKRGNNFRRSCGELPRRSSEDWSSRSETVQRRSFYQKEQIRRPQSMQFVTEGDEDSGYHTGKSDVAKSPPQPLPPPARGQRTLTRDELRRRITAFNDNNHGLVMEMAEGCETFQGFIRVHMNLIRPINMCISMKPPSIYDVLPHEMDSVPDEDVTITPFQLPKDTTKVIHIESATTTQEVIRALLTKFHIRDNPRKFALYERNERPGQKAYMRRMYDDEQPLPLLLSWTDTGLDGLDTNKFVLQENDTGEILWESFSVPELENFLSVLNREEEEYVDQVKTKYRLLKVQMVKRMKALEPPAQSGRKDKRTPIYV